MVTEKDVFVTMRDGAKVAVDIFRPDAPGEFPVIYATSAYQKDLAYLPQVPAFHFRETNDIEWFVSRGYVYVHQDIRGSGKSVDGEWQFFSREEQNDFYDVIEWAAEQSWSNGKVGMIGESYLGWVQWFAAAQQPPHLACIAPYDAGADMYRDVAYHGGIMSVGFPDRLAHVGDPRATTGWAGPAPTPTRGAGTCPGTSSTTPPATTSGRTAAPTSPRSSARCSASACCTRSASTCAATSAATRSCRRPRSWCSATATSRATRWPSSTRPRCACCCCAGTTTGSRATTPASWTRTR